MIVIGRRKDMKEVKKNHRAMKLIGIILIVLLIPIIIYTAMVVDTNPVMQRAEQHFSGEIEPDEKDPLNRHNFNANRDQSYHDAKTVKYKLKREFVWHNFKDGYILIKYDCRYYDENGVLGYGSAGVHAKWIIHKENGEWQVTKIIEAP